ncbi:murein hydrolase activator EnvC [Orbaceae bacterium ac157xtp]
MRFFTLFCIFFLYASGLLSAPAMADDKQDLQALRSSIIEQEKKLAQQKQQRASLLLELKKQETAIANSLNVLDKTNKNLANINVEIKQLIPDIEKLEATESKQKKLLAKQLESTFKLGKTSSMDLIFSGEDSQRNERIITYYGYINQARQTLINDLKVTQEELNSKKSALQQKKQSQTDLLAEQKSQHALLVKNRQQRQNTISQLEKSMQLNQQKLAELKENEANLQAQIVKAEKENKRIAENEAKQAANIAAKQKSFNYNPTRDEKALMARVSGIGKPQHNLSWPVKGQILYRFGQPLQGELHWKGMVIKAKEGTQVSAIASGRVILANWLQGYGFMVVLDHGKGDMSIYGYNQRVLVNIGDNVEAGQAIALVGTSGGKNSASLYFEIRRDGKALDPSAWLKK